jgi:hypothetical protein
VLKVLHHPISDKLSFLALAISIRDRAIAITANPAINQVKIARTKLPCEPSKTDLDFRNIPAPTDEPTTTSMAEKNEIFFFNGAAEIPCSTLLSFCFLDILKFLS